MKTIGLIGGMSWESSNEYYRIINEGIRDRLGGVHSAKSLMISVDFAEVEALQHRGNWVEAALMMVEAAQSLERGGADFIVLCTNTMHKLADEIQACVRIPFLHIADATAERCRGRHPSDWAARYALTMEEDFYKGGSQPNTGGSDHAGRRRARHAIG